MAVLSDLHGNVYGKDNKKLIDAVKRSRPDLILIPGDLITGEGTFEVVQMLALVKKLSMICPVYMSPGNHECKVKWMSSRFSYTYKELLERIQDAGATVLDNETLFLPQYNMEIKGLTLPESYFRKEMDISLRQQDLHSYVGKIREERFTLLSAHNPEYFDSYADYGADLTISGHLHGGIVRLPKVGGVISPKYVLFPPYTYGKFSKNGYQMLVSRGLGSHTIPLRVFNPGELMIVDVRQVEKKR